MLSSTLPGDWVLDPFAGTGTTAVVARQLNRHSVSIEIDPQNVACIRWRLEACREADSIASLRHYYRFTPDLERIWSGKQENHFTLAEQPNLFERQLSLFEERE